MTMSIDQFRHLALHSQVYDEIDQLCWDWLTEAAKDYGHNGQVALELMRMIKERLMS